MEQEVKKPRTLIFNSSDYLNLKKGNAYSVCLRRAREYPKGEEITILDAFDPHPAIVENTVQLVFQDLETQDIQDNVKPDCRTYQSLLEDMQEVYPGFRPREIVTILRFKIL